MSTSPAIFFVAKQLHIYHVIFFMFVDENIFLKRYEEFIIIQRKMRI